MPARAHTHTQGLTEAPVKTSDTHGRVRVALLTGVKMFFLWESFLRLERFLRDCDSYTRGLDTGAAVVLSYSALFTYLYFLLYTFIQRRFELFVLWNGLFFSGALLWLLSEITPGIRNADAPCDLNATGSARPAEEVTIVVYVSAYFWLYDLAFGPPEDYRPWSRHSVWLGARFLTTLAYLVLSIGALRYLGLHSWVSILAGGCVGVWGALFAVCGSEEHTSELQSQR